MNAPKCQPEDYINYLVASPRVVSGTEAARVQPAQPIYVTVGVWVRWSTACRPRMSVHGAGHIADDALSDRHAVDLGKAVDTP